MKRMVTALLLVAACASRGPTTPTTESPIQETFDASRWGNEVTVVTLNDGTRCAMLEGPYGAGGIDCDWRQG